MISFKHNGESILFPASYGECTLRQFFGLRDRWHDALDLISILSNIPRKTWEQDTDIDVIDKILPFIDFIKQPMPEFDQFLLPDNILIQGTRYDRPKGLGLKTLAQKWAFEDAVRKAEKDVDVIPMALAIYFQPAIDGTGFEPDRLEAVKEIVLDCLVAEAFPIAGFFFMKYELYCSERPKTLEALTQQLKNDGQELTDSKSSVSMQRFGLLRRVLIKLSRWFLKRIIIPVTLKCGIKKKNPAIKSDSTKF